MKKCLFERNRAIDIFFRVTLTGTFIAMFGILIYYVFAFASLFNGNDSFNWLLGIFSDFVEIMNVSIEESPYIIEGSSYPPLAIIILYPFALICKGVFARYAGQTLTVDELTSKLTMSPEFWISISLFFLICSSIIILIVAKKYDLHGATLFKVAITIMISAPFIYAIIRGNTIYFALIFVMLFLLLKDSKSAAIREISYLCLAVSGCLKIYPLFFGVFLLKDKKFFASLRVAAYFFAIFFLSFFFFERDLHDLSEFTENLGGFMTNEVRLLGFNNLSISALLFKIIHIFVPTLTAENTLFTVINISVLTIVFVCSTVAAIATKNDFTRLLICSSIVVLVPSISYFYVLVFTILPFLEYLLKEGEKMSEKKATLYFIAFMFLFIAFFVLPKFFIPHSLIILAMLCSEVCAVIKKEIFN